MALPIPAWFAGAVASLEDALALIGDQQAAVVLASSRRSPVDQPAVEALVIPGAMVVLDE